MLKLVEPVVKLALAAFIIVGAYHAGKIKEREWWRAEIAEKSSRVQAAMKKLSQDADDFDAALVKMIGDDNAKLAELEAKVSEPLPAAAAPHDDRCKPVPAHCLRRQGPGGAPARSAAAGQ